MDESKYGLFWDVCDVIIIYTHYKRFHNFIWTREVVDSVLIKNSVEFGNNFETWSFKNNRNNYDKQQQFMENMCLPEVQY